jgi:protein-S-isoprenylcysteine O-methyltransferase Ste14
MAILALVLLVAWLVLVAGLRGYVMYRRGGGPPVAFKDRPGSAQWWARLISTVGIVFAFAAPVAELAGLAPIAFLDQDVLRWAGVVLVALGTAGTLAAQWAMGDAWRADVDPAAQAGTLVKNGPFRIVRNPILTTTAVTVIGLALMVPNIIAVAMLVAVVLAIEIQVRFVEEPYLLGVYGDGYRSYAARTGRFLPGIGRLRSDRSDLQVR